MDKKIRIGTRGSKLALWQAHFVKKSLEDLGVTVEIKIIQTKGDKIQHLSFDKIEGKGFFTKEIEESLLNGEIDLAVHSMKDLPTQSTPGLKIVGVSERANPSDWMVINKESTDPQNLFKLKNQAIVGTSSARRKAQLFSFRPDIILQDIRGNVPTRLRKLQENQFDAIILAAAGLSRLEIDLSDFVVVKFHPKEFVPAPAQGVLAYQVAEEDIETIRIIRKIHHPETVSATNIERKVLRLFDGGCHLPLGVFCEKDENGNFHVNAAMAKSLDTPVKSVQFSSGTSYGLAEKIFELLNEQN